MKTVKIDENQALKHYKTASPEFKAILEDTFGKDFFNQDLTKTLNDWGDILKYSGKKEFDIIPWLNVKNPNKEQKSQIALAKLQVITEVYNQNWKADIINTSQYKWMFYKYVSYGRLFLDCDLSYGYCYVPVGLYSKDKVTCEAIMNNFPELVSDYLEI